MKYVLIKSFLTILTAINLPCVANAKTNVTGRSDLNIELVVTCAITLLLAILVIYVRAKIERKKYE